MFPKNAKCYRVGIKPIIAWSQVQTLMGRQSPKQDKPRKACPVLVLSPHAPLVSARQAPVFPPTHPHFAETFGGFVQNIGKVCPKHWKGFPETLGRFWLWLAFESSFRCARSWISLFSIHSQKTGQAAKSLSRSDLVTQAEAGAVFL
jgi:hypothetical protein